MRLVVLGTLVSLLAVRSATAGVVFEAVPDVPRAEVRQVVVAGDDVAVLLGARGAGQVLLREGGVWKGLPSPAGAAIRTLDLSADRVAIVLESCTQAGSNTVEIWSFDRRVERWDRLTEPPSANACDTSLAVAIAGEETLLRSGTRNLLRYAEGRWGIPDGTPESVSVWGQGFVKDRGRLFVLGAPAFEYVNGRSAVLPQPFTSGMIGVAVLEDGVALQAIGPSYSSTLHLPGDARRYAIPPVSQGGIFTWRNALWVRGDLGLFERSEGRWVLSRWPEKGGASCLARTEDGELLLGTTDGLIRALPRTSRFVPVAVQSRGPDGRRFTTALLLGNFGERSVRAVVTFRPSSGIVGGTRTRERALAPGTEHRVPDVIGWFEEDGGPLTDEGADVLGSLRVDFEGCEKDDASWAAAEVRSDGPGGTFSTFVPAPLAGTSLGWGSVGARGPVLRSGEGERTNVGWCDAGNGGNGAPLATPFQWTVLNASEAGFVEFFTVGGEWGQLPVHQLFPAARRGDEVSLSGPRDDCVVCDKPFTSSPRDLFGWVVDVDSRTGDGSYSLLSTMQHDLDRIALFFPALVRTRGAGGSAWSTTIQVGRTVPGRYGNEVRYTFRGLIDGAARVVSWKRSLSVRGAHQFDGAAEVIQRAGLVENGQRVDGTLLVDAETDQQDGLFGESRIAGRRDDTGAGFGARLEGVSEGSWARRNAVVPGLAEGRGVRSNLVLANAERPGGKAVTLRVDLLQSRDGSLLGSLERRLEPGERVQVNRVLREVTAVEERLEAWADIRSLGAGGRFVAYGVVHDDRSDDGVERPMTRVE